jgi:predicted amidohydrolase YtcJ
MDFEQHGRHELYAGRLNATVLAAHKAGWQIWTHANGDRAQDMIITAHEARAH